MNIRRLIWRNLAFYWKKHLLLALGVAVSGAVITGALMVGDSVKYSLNQIVEQRLGEVTHVLKAGERYFTTGLAEKVEQELSIPVASLLLQEGSAVAGGGKLRINNLRVYGVDGAFDRMAGLHRFYSTLSGDSIIISHNLASRLNVERGDEILLRIEKASLIPLNAPFVSDAEATLSFRATISDVADEEQMGRFNLNVSQTAPFNVFLSRTRLQELMDFSGRANVMLFSAGDHTESEEIIAAVDHHLSAADAGLRLSSVEDLQQLEITSDRVFIDDVLSAPLFDAAAGEAIVTYFVNSIGCETRSTPYSFVSTLPDSWLSPGEVIINRWLADDLEAGEGDTIRMTYFEVGPLRELEEATTPFVVKAVVPMEGRFGDATLMPALPGLSDAGNCRDWDTGVPIELERIRDRDEDYWDRYGGVPKAFVSVAMGARMWENRFGTYTAFRYQTSGTEDPGISQLEAAIMEQIDPAMLGFVPEPVRSKGLDAAASGVDFSQLFGGLSFFLLLAGILLIVLLFLLNIESREEQLGTLVVMGIPVRMVRRIMFIEGVAVSILGALAGLALAIVYNRLVFHALNGIWRDVVRTEMMHVDVRTITLVTGWTVTVTIALVALWFPLSRKLKRKSLRYRKRAAQGEHRTGLITARVAALLFAVTGIAALALIGSQLIRGELVNVPVFFAAGGLLLVSAVSLFLWYLGKRQEPAGSRFDLTMLSWKNATRNRTRSMGIVILFAIGAFLVISTGSNRKDLFVNAADPTSGTGGFLYYGETTVPVLQQLNEPAVRSGFGLDGEYGFVQLRRADGDDASCLNLNRIVNPRILGVDPEQMEGRFSFVTRTPFLDEANPWRSLDRDLPGGLIPAIADETAIKWGLGLSVGDTLHYTNSGGERMELLLIGGVAPSIFQGSVIISGNRFLEQFPGSSGTRLFLVEGEAADTALIKSELNRGLRDLGLELQLASERLTEFNSVTNAYLSIFMVMGALGLLLGTFGLVVVLSRSILERRKEIALLKAVGYEQKKIRRVITREYMLLLFAGVGAGFGTAIIATLPSIASAHTGTSVTSILLWLALLMVNGWLWIQVITRSALKERVLNKELRNE
ncbi:MAG: ABC transporter permease [Bacteroidota bacterium]